MSITATNNPYPDSPDPSPSKLDRGGYEGTAETLDNKIDSTLAEAELLINNFLTDSTLIGNPSIAIPAEITGNAHCIGVGPGTYAFWGGMVVPANNIATLRRVDGEFFVSLTSVGEINKMLYWVDGAYPNGTQRTYNEIDWIANTDTLLGDIPGISPKWTKRLNLYPQLYEILQEGFGITDEDGNIAFKVDNDGVKAKEYHICDNTGTIVGTFNAASLTSLESLTVLLASFNIDTRFLEDFYITDSDNNIALKYDTDGFDVAKLSTHFKSLLSSSSNNGFVSVGNFVDDMNMNIIYGQSLAVGGTTISAEDFLTSKMFNSGVLITPPADGDINSKSYNDTYFGNIVDMSTTGGGLNARMMCKKWNELIVSEDEIDLDSFAFNLMGFVSGVSGGDWFQLNKTNISIDGTGWATLTAFDANNVGRAYCNLLHGVYFAREKAHAQGKSLNVNTLSWVQGEAGSEKQNTVTDYYNKLVTIFTDLNNDIKTITGQTNDIEFIIYQNASFAIYQVPTSPDYVNGMYTEGVPLACLKAAKDLPNVTFATPLYPFSPSQATSDKIHLGNIGHAMMASHFGITAKRVITDKKTLKNFYPNATSIFNDGTNYFVKVKFDVIQKPLVFDTTGDDGNNMLGHGAQPNYGFSIKTGGGTEIITAVRLSGNDSVIITTSQNPTGLDLTYAWTGVFGGGNLRDSQGDTITTTFNGVTYRCDNWCPFFRITI